MSENKYLEFSQRLNSLMKKNDVSLRDISDHTKINYEMVRRYVNGLAKPREEKMKLLADFLKTTVSYLDYGETSTQIQTQNGQSQRQAKDNAIILPPSSFRKVPVLNMVQAGLWSRRFENEYDEYIEVPDIYGEDVFGLKIDGYSMITDFYPQDIVFIDPNIEPLTGDFVVANNEEYESTFKKYRKHYDPNTDKEWFELIPSNSEFEPIDSRVEPFSVIGVAVGRHQFFRRGRN